MFQLTPDMMRTWLKGHRPKASPADVAVIESHFSTTLPPDYVEFVQRFGFAIFGDDPERRWLFSYTMDGAGQREVREDALAYLYEPEKMFRVHLYMTSLDYPEDPSRPMLPTGYLPIGNAPGQGTLLLQIGEPAGRIWYQPDTEFRWGEGDNTQLGFVAESFTDFINGLRPDPL